MGEDDDDLLPSPGGCDDVTLWGFASFDEPLVRVEFFVLFLPLDSIETILELTLIFF